MVRDLAHVVNRAERQDRRVHHTGRIHRARCETEAVKAGFYETLYGKYPKIQILTIANCSRANSQTYRWWIPLRSRGQRKKEWGPESAAV